MRDELLKIARSDPPTLVEANIRKCRKLVTGKSENLEMRAAAIQRDALLSRGGDANWSRRQLASDLAELLGRNRDGARRLHVGRDFGRHGDIEIGARKANALFG